MKIAILIVRSLLGLAFVVFGLNGFLHFMPMGEPPTPDSPAAHFFAAVATTGFMNVVFVCQLVGGLLLLLNFLPVLGLTILGPVIFNILLFHLTIMPKGIFPGVAVAVMALFLVWAYWEHYRHLLRQPAK